MVEADAIADVQHCQGFGGVDGVEQVQACMDRVGDRDQVCVELAGGDLVEQKWLPGGKLWRAIEVRGQAGRLMTGVAARAVSGALADGLEVSGEGQTRSCTYRSERFATILLVTASGTIDLAGARARLAELDTERAALRSAIAKVEREHGGPDVTTALGRVELFASLSRGRPDVFATRLESTRTPD